MLRDLKLSINDCSKAASEAMEALGFIKRNFSIRSGLKFVFEKRHCKLRKGTKKSNETGERS